MLFGVICGHVVSKKEQELKGFLIFWLALNKNKILQFKNDF